MNRKFSKVIITAVSLAFLLPTSAIASEEDKAMPLCKSKIEDVYGVNKLHDVWSDRDGNHKFMVHGRLISMPISMPWWLHASPAKEK